MKPVCWIPKYKTPVEPWERSSGYGPDDRMIPFYRRWRGSSIASIKAPRNMPYPSITPFFCSASHWTRWCETEEESIKFVESKLIEEGYSVKGLLWTEE